MTLQTALQQGTQLLNEARIPVPRLTAEVLLCHALRQRREYLYAHSDEELTELGWIHYGRYLHQRMNGVPTQYITKEQEFYGRPFFVSPDVLIPRSETEHLIETALRLAPHAKTIIDVGCGSGAIAVTLACELPAAVVSASDISLAALRVAEKNAATNQVRVSLLQCDLLEAVREKCFDVIVSNPPYVPDEEKDVIQQEVRDHEPAVALYGGPTGNEIYARLIPQAERVLKPGGWLMLELGYKSLAAVRAMLGPAWSNVHDVPDLAGIPRVLVGQLF